MNKLVWRNIVRFVLLMLVQLLVLNHVYFGGYVMPMLYLLFILMLPTSTGRIPMLLIAFGTGLLVDVMNNMLGFHALACTVIAMLRILFADRILTRNEPVVIESPSIYSVTPQYFISYLMLLLAAFYLVFYTVELFGFRNFGGVLLSTILSTVVTTLLAVLYQFLFLKKETSI
ncbi:MAG: rod shape-determining protein MreD [bacterium]